ncbi:MAG: CotH kinase family protein [Candidatus Cryptobacteroides sp.]
MRTFKAIKTAFAFAAFALAFAACQEKDDGPDEYVIPSIDLKLDSFSFLAVNNPILGGEDAFGKIEGDTIFIDCPGVTSLNQMVPSFSGSYVKVLVDGVKITPGQSVVNFSKVREVVLQGYTDSKTRKYCLCIRIQNLIPKVSIRTGSEITSRTEYLPATITVTNYPFADNISAPGKAKGRGNATFLSYPKKSYKFKLDEAQKVCGFRKNRDWVLLAEYCDKSLMRTTYMNALSKAAGCEWTPEAAHVELYLNGSYNGVYLLIEQVEKAKHKIDIGDEGFIIEDDNYYSWEPLYFKTDLYGRHYTFKYPDVSDGEISRNDDNYNYIKDFMNKMEASLRSGDFRDPEKGYRKYIDVPSFVRWYLVMELLSCQDPNFFYVLPARGEKLKMYPAWDAEWILGNAYAGPGGWTSLPQDFEKLENWRKKRYFPELFRDPYFVEQVYFTWQDLKERLGDVREAVALETETIRLAQEDNFEKWDILNRRVSVEQIVFGSWERELDYASDWFEKRIAWFDTYISDLYNSSR